jgi:thiol-disulfide isomerase/thioredoxin
MNKIILIGLLLIQTISFSQENNLDGFKIIADSTNIYKSIDDILRINDFDNNVVYVDIWGTRCGPCLQEFAHTAELKERFRDKPIKFLYACSPYTMEWDKDNEKLWKELIAKYNLKGVNVFMSPECYMEGFFEKYSDKYPENEKWSIPAYLLVNKKGEIVNFRAARPSTKEKLYAEIEKLLDE